MSSATDRGTAAHFRSQSGAAGRIKAYLDLCRVSNLPTVWTNVLAATILSGAVFSPGTFIVLALALSFLYAGGMCLNDICDAVRDRAIKAFRPIPSGRISLRAALFFTGVLCAAGLVIVVLAPFPKGLPAGFVLLALIIAYDALHADRPWTVLLMAGCRLMVFIVCALAVTGHIPFPVVIGAVAQFMYVVIISVVARYENGRGKAFVFPVIPWMIAGISLLDGALMGLLATPLWVVAGVGGALLTLLGQRFVRGD